MKKEFAVMAVVLTTILCGAKEVMPIVQMRGGIGNALYRIEKEKQTTVAFIGGSIVEMRGFSKLTEEFLMKTYPECRFTFINAGIGSTCSDLGAARLKRDVLSKAKRIDLLFVEFATNDRGDGNFKEEYSARAMEGIVRQARKSNPGMDIVFLYTANESFTKDFSFAVMPSIISAHEKVAAYYALSSVSFAQDIAERLEKKEFDWKKFGGVHPSPFGAGLYLNDMKALILAGKANVKPISYPLPETKLDRFCFENGKLIDIHAAKIGDGWKIEVPDWKKLGGNTRKRYTSIPMLCGSGAGSEFVLEFTGTAIGVFVSSGFDCGSIDYSIDGAPFQTKELFFWHSPNLHYPLHRCLASNLEDGKHTLKVKIGKDRTKTSYGVSKGNVVRIMAFTGN